jgi:hypothetical protein
MHFIKDREIIQILFEERHLWRQYLAESMALPFLWITAMKRHCVFLTLIF